MGWLRCFSAHRGGFAENECRGTALRMDYDDKRRNCRACRNWIGGSEDVRQEIRQEDLKSQHLGLGTANGRSFEQTGVSLGPLRS